MDSEEASHGVQIHLDRLLQERGMTLTELATRVDLTIVNLSILKNGRARAIRFSTLTALCDALGCQPGDLMSVVTNGTPSEDSASQPTAG
jgi:putative transcriptional regulator